MNHHKRTPEAKATTLARKRVRAVKYAPPTPHPPQRSDERPPVPSIRQAADDARNAATSTKTVVACVYDAVNYIRKHDCDFLTAETVAMYAHVTEAEARAVLVPLMADPRPWTMRA